MNDVIRSRAAHALLQQNEKAAPSDRVPFKSAFVVGDKIFLAEHAAHAWRSQVANDKPVEVLTYKDAYDQFLRRR